MIFLIDESIKFTFDAKNPKKKFALAAGVAISMHNAERLVDHIKANYTKDGNILKGCNINDDDLVKKFIEQLLNCKAYASVSVGDYVYVRGVDAAIYKEQLCNDLIKFALEPHPEYQSFKDEKTKLDLQNKVKALTEKLKEFDMQEFYQLLMIFDVIEDLIRKNLMGYYPVQDSFDGITIVIDTQIEAVSYIINEDLFYYFLFAVSRKENFDITTSISIFKKYINGSYLDATKLIKEIKVRSDNDDERLYIADYVASFYSKSLNGIIKTEDVIDKLLFLHKNKLRAPYIFHPKIEEMAFPINKENKYMVKTFFC